MHSNAAKTWRGEEEEALRVQGLEFFAIVQSVKTFFIADFMESAASSFLNFFELSGSLNQSGKLHIFYLTFHLLTLIFLLRMFWSEVDSCDCFGSKFIF